MSKDTLGLLNIYITVEEAVEYSGIPLSSFVSACKESYIPHINGDFTDSKEENKLLASTIKIPLTELMEDDILKYLIDNIYSGNFIKNLDLLAIKRKYGSEYCDKLINNLAIIREIEKYRTISNCSSYSSLEKEILKEYGLTQAVYLKERNNYLPFLYTPNMANILRKTNRNKSNPSMCPASKLHVLNKLLLPDSLDVEIIHNNLIQEAKEKGRNYCNNCIHNIKSNEYKSLKEDIDNNHPNAKLEICLNNKDSGMLVPSYTTITRFIKDNVNNSFSYYCTHDRQLWRAKYGNKIIREDPMKINTVFFGDHSQLDILLIYDIDDKNSPILRKPWLTTMMDAASGFPTGYIISFVPDEFTIGYCFAHACVLKPNYISAGVPLYCYFDRGRDYRSSFVATNDKELIQWNKEAHFLNRSIFSSGIIRALESEIRYANAKSPWVKSIERLFKDINKAIKRYPGYVGGKKHKKIKEKEINRLVKSNMLLTIEEFSLYFKEDILPFVVNKKSRGKKSKYEKYTSLEREDTIIPEWNSLSPFLKMRNTYEVKSTGILIRKKELIRNNDGTFQKQEVERYYNAKCLDDYKGCRVIVYTLDELYKDSIFCLYEEKSNNKNKKTHYIGEAFLVKEVGMIEENRFTLQKNLMHQKLQERNIKNKLYAIRYFSDHHNFVSKRYITEEFVDRVDTIGEIPTLENPASKIVSKEAALAKIDECKRIIEILSKMINEQYPS